MRHRFCFLALAALVAACSTETTAPPTQLAPAPRAPSMDVSLSSGAVLDNFTAGGGTWLACTGPSFNLFADASIAGGQRETYARDGGTCNRGPASAANVTIDAAAATMTWGGNNTYSPEYGVAYGTAIGYVQPSWLSDPNRGKGTPLHLALTPTDKIQITMLQVFSGNPGITILVRDASGNTYSHDVQLVVGTNTIPLSAFGISAAAASDIYGIGFKTYGIQAPGDVFSGFGVAPSDNTPPVITPTVTGTLGSNGWYTSDVTVSWSVTDGESAVASSSGCDDASITTDTDGQTITCTATSAGGTNQQSVTIKRDHTAPTVSYTGNAGSYTVDQSVAITCSATDATNPGSGLASSTCQDISGDAYTFSIGANSFSATATDNAGNVGGNSTSFTVAVTSGGVCTLTQRWVTQPGNGGGIANSLCVKLQHGQTGAYVNEVSAQSGKAIAADKAAILIGLAKQL